MENDTTESVKQRIGEHRAQRTWKHPFTVVAALSHVLASLAATGSLAQTQCTMGNENPWVLPTTPSDAFDEREDGTVLHRPTRLVWQRCVLGQNWDGQTCTGVPQLLQWHQALAAAEAHLQDGHVDWRVPNRNELESILEARCYLPPLNAGEFPGAPAGSHWTSSPVFDATEQTWVVIFDDGRTEPAPVGGLFHLRLVRGGWDD